jgi:hypothetical protein
MATLKLDDQIANYKDSYGCTLESLISQRDRVFDKQQKKVHREWKRAHKVAKARLKYYRSLRDWRGDRTHRDDGTPLYDQWGNPDF